MTIRNKNYREEQAGHGEKEKRRQLHNVNNYVSLHWHTCGSNSSAELSTSRAHTLEENSLAQEKYIFYNHTILYNPPTRSFAIRGFNGNSRFLLQKVMLELTTYA